ncbi:MAG: DUF4129 domain-containing protein, partial [Chitinophagaceae bacterium]
ILKLDSTKIAPAKFNKQALEAYAEQKEFQYDAALTRDLSLWDRFWMWFWRMVNELFTGAASNPVSKYFFIGLGIAILLYIVIKIIGAENIFSKKSKETILPYDILNENIHEIDYETEIQKLIDQRKYRLAVRLLYLRSLKKLSDAEIIKWQPEKTNYNYLTEISKPEIKNEFGLLTHQFDYIWYGDFPVDAQKFEPINQSFNHFNSQIK